MQGAVLGAGTMGHGIAQVSAMAGHEVQLRDIESGRVAEPPNGTGTTDDEINATPERAGTTNTSPDGAGTTNSDPDRGTER